MTRGAPRRWLDESGGGLADERDLLRTGLDVDPPEGQKDAVWAAILAGIPPGGGGGAAGGGAGKATATKGIASAAKAGASAAKAGASAKTMAVATGGGVLKSALIGAGSAAVLVGAYTAVAPKSEPVGEPAASVATANAVAPPLDLSPARGPRDAPGVAPSSAPTTDPAPSAPAADTLPAAAAPDPRAVISPGAPGGAAGPAPAAGSAPQAAAADAAKETEAQAVSAAREALHRGDATGTLAQLEQMRTRFPENKLAQEREALAIEALYRSGQHDAARARAGAFLRAHPTSVHATRVQSFAQ